MITTNPEAETAPQSNGQAATKDQAPQEDRAKIKAISLLGGWNAPQTHSGSVMALRSARRTPPVKLARLAATAPIRAVGLPSVAAVDGTSPPESAVEEVAALVGKLWRHFLSDCMYAIDYGWAGFEQIWGRQGNRITPQRLKPLLHEITRPMVDAAGNFTGIKNGKVELPPEQTVWVVHEGEAGSLFGEGRLSPETMQVVHTWKIIMQKSSGYAQRVAFPTPMVQYPEGESLTSDGRRVDNYEAAQAIVNALGRGDGITMPNQIVQYAAQVAGRHGFDPATMKAWHIDFLKAEGSHGQDIATLEGLMTKNIVRAYCVPERAITEGEHGTKAEAETHSKPIFAAAEDTLESFVEQFTEQVVRRYLSFNYATEVAEQIQLSAPPIQDDDRALVRQIIESIMSNPQGLAFLSDVVDLDSMLDSAGLPRVEQSEEPDPVRLEELPEGMEGAPADALAGLEGVARGAAAAVGGGGGAPTKVQDTALNGAQITALLEITGQVQAGDLPADAGKAIAVAAFPTMPQSQIDSIFDKLTPGSNAPAPVPPQLQPSPEGQGQPQSGDEGQDDA